MITSKIWGTKGIIINMSTVVQKGFSSVLIIIIVAALLGIGFWGYLMMKKGETTPTYVPLATTKPSASAKPRSVAPGVITQAVFAKSIDPKTGMPVNPGMVFSKSDPEINLVVSLQNPKIGTKIEYVRYLNDKFMDNKSTTTTKATDTSVVFNWNLKQPGAVHLMGNYKVRLYTNGIFEKEATYSGQ